MRLARPTVRRLGSGVDDRLVSFARSRRGIEAFLEPATAITPMTLLLVAGDGEWMRRPVSDAKQAARFAHRHGLPLYEAERVGYPRRMREWSARGS
jgi:hypothetical protein